MCPDALTGLFLSTLQCSGGKGMWWCRYKLKVKFEVQGASNKSLYFACKIVRMLTCEIILVLSCTHVISELSDPKNQVFPTFRYGITAF